MDSLNFNFRQESAGNLIFPLISQLIVASSFDISLPQIINIIF